MTEDQILNMKTYLNKHGYNTEGATDDEIVKMWEDDIANYEGAKARRRR